MSKALLQDFWYDVQSKKQIQLLVVLVSLALASALGWTVYKAHVVRKTQEAHKAFTDGITEFETVAQRPAGSQNWSAVAELFGAAYDRYKASAFGPFMLAYKAQALSYEGNSSAALDAMNQAVALLDKQNPLFSLYATKLALMKKDSADEAVKASGLQELEALAHDVRNPVKDMARYYLGYQAYTQRDLEKAKSIWSTLITQADADSVWSNLAQHQLSLI